MEHLSDRNNKQKGIRYDAASFFQEIPLIIKLLVSSRGNRTLLDFVNHKRIPSQEKIVKIIHRSRQILFPGYFSQNALKHHNPEKSLGIEMKKLFEDLAEQIMLSLRHDCFKYEYPCPDCFERSHDMAKSYIRALPEIKEILSTDIHATIQGDPAAKSTDEIIFSYPGFLAITVYRLAHILYGLNVPMLPRIMTEYAHTRTGIDIHPGAKIGKSFFIDHGTGVVVGETTEIGDRVRLYQGVTLGALSLPKDAAERYMNKKRHPTIEDDVIIYSNATILGRRAVIGARSIIGGNVWITDRIPPDTKVMLKRPELIVFEHHKNDEA